MSYRMTKDLVKEGVSEVWRSGGAGDLALVRQLGMFHPIIGAKWVVKRYGVVIDEPGIKNGNPCVIRDGDIYRMYHTRKVSATEPFHIVMRTSYDGKSWTSPVTVMTADMVNAAGYDITGVFQPSVLKENGTYYMFFAGDQMQPWGVRRRQIFLATSTDGVNFSGIRAVLTPRQNSMEEECWHPFVAKFRGKYYMTYIGTDFRFPETNPMRFRLMLCESGDLETWTKLGIISMEGALGEWDGGKMFDHSIININDSLLLIVYAAEATAGNEDMRIGLAYSFDMKHWFGRRMLLCRVLDSEARYIADCSILYEGGKIKIWYEANDGVKDPTTGQATVREIYGEAVMSDVHVMELWINKTVPVAGLTTDDVDTKFEKVSFHLISDQDGTGYVQAYDEAAGDFKDVYSFSVSADTLTVETPAFKAKRMRLRFVPSAEAMVSAWMVAE